MARLFIDGFEHGDAGLWDAGATVKIGGDTITGSYCVYSNSTSTLDISKTISSSAIVILAARFNTSYIYGSTFFKIYFYTSTDDIVTRITGERLSSTSWKIDVVNGADLGTIIGTYTLDSSDDCCHIQIMLENVSSFSKDVIVKINNIERININFNNAGETTTPRLMISLHADDPDYPIYMDDVVIDDANWPGAPLIYGLIPNADGATNEWSPSTGSDNYDVVNEVPANTSGYVSSTISGEIDLYDFSNLPDTDVWSINSVQVSAYAKTPGPPEDEYIQLGVRSGGSNHFGERQQLSTSFAQLSDIFENNPITAAAWTQDEVNSGEFGMKEVS